MSLTIFQNEKTPFQALNTRRSKSRKIDVFPKGLTHGFGPKVAIFFNFFFLGNIGQEHVFYDILERNNAILGYKKRSSKSRKIAIFSNGLTHVFGLKMIIFPTFFFQAKQARKMSFTIFQNEKTAFQAIKTRTSKKQEIPIFLRGLTHGFWTKIAIFATSFFQAKQARKMSFTIFQIEKMAFWAIKTRSSKNQEIAIFLKGLPNGFGPKMAVFFTSLFLGNRGQENVFYDILE